MPISPRCRELIDSMPRRIDTPYIFMGPSGMTLVRENGKYDDNPLERALKASWKAAGIPKVIFHDFRHTFASRMAMAGVSLFTVAKLGRWKSISVLEQRYAHLQPDHLEAAMDRPYIGEEKREREENERDKKGKKNY